MFNDIEHYEMELSWARDKFDELFQTDGSVVPGTEWITLFSRSLTIIEFEDKIFEMKNSNA